MVSLEPVHSSPVCVVTSDRFGQASQGEGESKVFVDPFAGFLVHAAIFTVNLYRRQLSEVRFLWASEAGLEFD